MKSQEIPIIVTKQPLTVFAMGLFVGVYFEFGSPGLN